MYEAPALAILVNTLLEGFGAADGTDIRTPFFAPAGGGREGPHPRLSGFAGPKPGRRSCQVSRVRPTAC